jgi:hypothetical protein
MRWSWVDFATGLVVGAAVGFLILSIMLAFYIATGGKVGR